MSAASLLSRVTLDDHPRSPRRQRVASVASRVRGSAENIIVKNYAGRHAGKCRYAEPDPLLSRCFRIIGLTRPFVGRDR